MPGDIVDGGTIYVRHVVKLAYKKLQITRDGRHGDEKIGPMSQTMILVINMMSYGHGV